MTATQDVRPSRLPSLTGLRFLAALLVFINHVQHLNVFADPAVQKGYVKAVENAGQMGVSFFFILSGFVLTWVARRDDTVGQFYRRRFFKIVPNHVVAYLASLALLLAAGVPLFAPEAVANFFLVQSWMPSSDYIVYSVNGVTWSLSVEVLFYVSFPLLILLVGRLSPRRLWSWFVGLAVLSVVVPLVVAQFLPSGPKSPFAGPESWPVLWISYFFPPMRLFEFVAGMILAKIVMAGRFPRIGALPMALLTVAAYVVSIVALPPFSAYYVAAIYLVPMGLLIAALAVADDEGRRTVTGTRPMVWLGEISYAFFLIHLFILFNTHAALGGQWAGWGGYQRKALSTPLAVLFVLAVLGLCVLLSWLLYALVERPMMRHFSRPRRGGRPAGTVPTDPAALPTSPAPAGSATHPPAPTASSGV
ncbi:acyltransferase [Micromonospora sp. R77]|uniref:acyltransferase family protein n=1 Tax=Micromonospora sp. R77 TaxID=2925836 RepID=UPI001F605F91|nr:acyltransferase [Micromonospora sp. R77]MCI4061240.1 acyltransferase [Micromonospora sp. R77]